MDYDGTDIPAAYDRARDHGPEILNRWMQIVGGYFGVETRHALSILDLGCGTGRFTHALADYFDAEVIGVDPSVKMLALAEEKRTDPRVRYVKAPAESVPLPDNSIDLIFMSMSFHHFNDRERATRECRRILRDDGFVFMRTATREHVRSCAYVPFFPSTLAIMSATMQSDVEIRELFWNAGFRLVDQQTIVQQTTSGFGPYADKLEALGDSILVQISSEELERGIASMRALAGTADDRPIEEPVDILVFAPRNDHQGQGTHPLTQRRV